jgi:hypothetical protein
MKIYLPPLHIKLGLIKMYMKVINEEEEEGFDCLRLKFRRVSQAKTKETIFVRPQMKQLF